VAAVRERLREVYGPVLAPPHGQPLDELVLTVLSQSTNDRNRDVAFLRLRDRFAGWAAVRDAPVELVEEAIRPGGISRVKSVRIQEILRAVSTTDPPLDGDAGADTLKGAPWRAQAGELSLDWMREAPVEVGRDYLVALPGVGRKTAACVLLFAYGLRDVPVDTHVSRVGGRLRLLDAAAPLHVQHDQMLALTPPGAELELHINLLRHGRRTCTARSPGCDECALARMCPSRGMFGPAR
jgi:endonuclease-3